MKTANSTRKTAAVVAANLGSISARRSTPTPVFLFGGSRFRIRKYAMTQNSAQTRPTAHTAYRNPADSASHRIISGRMQPPVPPAVHAMPVARPCRLLNQCPMAETLGFKSIDAEMPPRMPNESREWYHSRLVVSVGRRTETR